MTSTTASAAARPALALRAMADPGFYPHRPRTVELRETHISRVFLAGERAYKVKKGVLLPFLDSRWLERRRELCEEEVRLNRRLAPAIYLGVRAIVPAAGAPGFRLAGADDPRAVEYAVEMVRYDEEQTLERVLRRGELTGDDVRRVASRLAAFHAVCPRVDPGPALAAMRRAIGDTVASLAISDLFDPVRVWACERFMGAFMAAHAAELVERGRRGLVRDGHGDLRAEHVVLGPRLEIVDCLEFDPSLRATDVAADLAFLVMDLHRLGADAHARRLVAAYRDAGGDPGEDALVAFFAAYRALVRAKVAAMRLEQLAPEDALRAGLAAEAHDLLRLARRLNWRGRLPLLLLIAGVPASGKSRLAGAIGEASGLAVLSSDVIRKRMLGIAPHERAAVGAYAPERNAATYAELGRLAASELGREGGMIVDATFRRAGDRSAFLEAVGPGARPVLVECIAPARVLAQRAARRALEPDRISDADQSVVERERASWQQPDEIAPARHLVLRTDRPVEQTLAALEAMLDHRLAAGG